MTENTVTLSCTITDGLLTSNRYLRWTERGRDVELLDRYSITSESINSLVLTVTNASYLDYGVYTCRCYNNITNFGVSGVQDLYHVTDNEFFPHCSEPFSVQALPLGMLILAIFLCEKTFKYINTSSTISLHASIYSPFSVYV